MISCNNDIVYTIISNHFFWFARSFINLTRSFITLAKRFVQIDRMYDNQSILQIQVTTIPGSGIMPDQTGSSPGALPLIPDTNTVSQQFRLSLKQVNYTTYLSYLR